MATASDTPNPELQRRIIEFMVVCINDFAEKHNLSYIDAFNYLYDFGGLKFIEEFYNVEHTLSFEDVLDDIEAICAKNGGTVGLGAKG